MILPADGSGRLDRNFIFFEAEHKMWCWTNDGLLGGDIGYYCIHYDEGLEKKINETVPR